MWLHASQDAEGELKACSFDFSCMLNSSKYYMTLC